MRVFRSHSVEQHAQSIAHLMPGGRVFAKGFDSTATLGKYLIGLACELYRVEEQMNMISEDHDVNSATQFIEQWESAVGIPDECLSNTGTLEDRRKNVLAKLAKMNLTTVQDFIDLAAVFGVTCTVRPGIDTITFPVTFPIPMFDTVKDARFTLVVNFTSAVERFPLTFPITFGSGAQAIVECLFNKLRPANVNMQYVS